MNFTSLLGLVIEHAVAEPFEIRIPDLVSKFLAHALVVLRLLQPAGTITAFFPETVLNQTNRLRIGIERDFHRN